MPAHGTSGEKPGPTAQIGHGCVLFPVRTVRDCSVMLSEDTPVTVSSVPVTGALNEFSTQAELPPLRTGSGVPNRHPTFVQSKLPGLLA